LTSENPLSFSAHDDDDISIEMMEILLNFPSQRPLLNLNLTKTFPSLSLSANLKIQTEERKKQTKYQKT